MATNTSDIRSTLNNLIETLKDGEEGFRTSAEKVKDSALRSQFMNFGSQRQRFASDLQGMVARIGGEPETSGSASGALHRGWMNLKAALAGNDDHAILEEAERGEDAAVKAYRDALSKDLPADLRNIVEQQYREIQNAHTQVRALRDGSQITGTATGGTTRTY